MRLQRNQVMAFMARLARHPRRSALLRAAIRYAEYGWDVVPGAWLQGRRFVCGRPACRIVSCHPAIDEWERMAGNDREVIARWWRRRPGAVLLATGRAFDVLEVPAELGQLAVGPDSRPATRGPVITSPGGRWLFLVQPGAVLSPQLAGRPDVVLHGRKSWIPAPPTRHPDDTVRWRVPPASAGFKLADPQQLQSLLVAGLPVVGRRELAAEPETEVRAFPPGWEPVPGLNAGPGLDVVPGLDAAAGVDAAIPGAGAARQPGEPNRNARGHFERTPRARLRRAGRLLV